MKIKILIVSILIVIAITIGTILIIKKTNKKEISELEYMYFSYSNGYAMNSNVRYSLEKNYDHYEVIIKPYEVSEEDKLETIVDKSFVDKVINILNKYDVASWDGFSKYDKDVLDGDSFSISINYLKEEYVSANGYMEYPDNYREVQRELDNIFMKLYNNKTGGNL